ncbi:hypothetical protein C8R48DRAFT_688190 [Suillus tomentosus]|nr:hypothetical protein C8R48DRAFT_688190 [Suillus tomentosus]
MVPSISMRAQRATYVYTSINNVRVQNKTNQFPSFKIHGIQARKIAFVGSSLMSIMYRYDSSAAPN